MESKWIHINKRRREERIDKAEKKESLRINGGVKKAETNRTGWKRKKAKENIREINKVNNKDNKTQSSNSETSLKR